MTAIGKAPGKIFHPYRAALVHHAMRAPRPRRHDAGAAALLNRFGAWSVTLPYEKTAEIVRAEQAFREALDELTERVRSGLRGYGTTLLVKHCHEMADLLASAVDRLGQGKDAHATRATAAALAARLTALEYEITRISLR
jgi:hypothetical protein